ncbi:hypothetical protein BLW98_23965 [Bacillus mycoides]|nr:hypothetical protein BLW98_23965 [Bacillus mycoides]
MNMHQKQERLECHLYGQLISILLCSSTMFKMRELLLRKKQKELSEYKAMYIIKDYFLLFHQALHKNTLSKKYNRGCPYGQLIYIILVINRQQWIEFSFWGESIFLS